jgi:hypothetical protein
MRTVRIAAVFMMGLLLLTPAACGGGGGGATPGDGTRGTVEKFPPALSAVIRQLRGAESSGDKRDRTLLPGLLAGLLLP